jgi:heme exporter protein D
MDGQVPSGMIQGGWEYVWAAYGVSWTVLLGLTVFVLLGSIVKRGSTDRTARRTP